MDAWIVSDTLANRPGLPYRVVNAVDDVLSDFYLTEQAGAWCLCARNAQFTPIFIDFSSPHYRYRGGVEYLPKAFKGMHGAHLADVTGGWGRDAWLLAYRGFRVTLYERNPYLSFLLRDAILHAQQADDAKIAEVAQRMEVISADAISEMEDIYDAVYMDPMFPERHKSAKVKKHMQALQALLGGEEGDAAALLDAACNHAAQRVVVKRPKGAPFVGTEAPSRSIDAPNTRYDIYLP